MMKRILGFDAKSGVIRAEAGLTFGELIVQTASLGWFPPVTPGTQHVTLGGALANDVHGKNHHRAGSFGHHVRAFELVRSDGSRRLCSPASNPDLFRATIGGMGLTGLVTWVEIALMQAASPDVDEQTIRFASLADFFRLSAESDASHCYSVAWIDSSARGSSLGRGIFLRANHAATPAPSNGRRFVAGVPFTPPLSLMTPASIGLLNRVQYARSRDGEQRRGWQEYFYPLDGIANWNRAYGPRGFHQHQCIIPLNGAEAGVAAILEAVQQAGSASFISVLKTFGAHEPRGMLSFARPGVTLALDLPNRGEDTLRLLARLDAIALKAGGAINPYKDARLSAEAFNASFPQVSGFRPFIDPALASQFSVRVGLTGSISAPALSAAE